jgi:hypothetical protein
MTTLEYIDRQKKQLEYLLYTAHWPPNHLEQMECASLVRELDVLDPGFRTSRDREAGWRNIVVTYKDLLIGQPPTPWWPPGTIAGFVP